MIDKQHIGPGGRRVGGQRGDGERSDKDRAGEQHQAAAGSRAGGRLPGVAPARAADHGRHRAERIDPGRDGRGRAAAAVPSAAAPAASWAA